MLLTQELANSGIKDFYAASANFHEASEREILDSLLGNLPREKRLNTGAVERGYLTAYKNAVDGGFLVRGCDPLARLEESDYCQVKLNTPRLDDKGKVKKYESPLELRRGLILFLRITGRQWKQIALKYGVDLPDIPIHNTDFYGLAFWDWVISNPQLPIAITEGGKKAQLLLEQNMITISLPGIYMGYRSPKDELGNKIGNTHLIPELELFAVPGREINFIFDCDPKQETRANVKQAELTTARLLEARGATCYSVSWIGEEKGIDDFYVVYGDEGLETILGAKVLMKKRHIEDLKEITVKDKVYVEQKYLSSSLITELASRYFLIGIKSDQGTGKTVSLSEHSKTDNNPLIGLTHRIALSTNLGGVFDLPTIDERFASKERGVFMCVDSLHALGKAREYLAKILETSDPFNIVIDEVEQVFPHIFNSSTCDKERAPILSMFKQVVIECYRRVGNIFLADANLTQIYIDLIEKLIGEPITKAVIINTYKQDRGTLYCFSENDPYRLLKQFTDFTNEGNTNYLFTCGQKIKSKTGTSNVGSYLKAKCVKQKSLVVDRETIGDSTQEAYRIANNLEKLNNYDAVITSAVLETGISITSDHFDAVYGSSWGRIPTNSVVQAMSRVREAVPRFLWAKEVSNTRIGCGSIYPSALLNAQNKQNQYILKSLAIREEDILDENFQPYQKAWARSAAITNYQYQNYRAEILEGFEDIGYTIQQIGSPPEEDKEIAKGVKKELALLAETNHQAWSEKVALSPDISSATYAQLQQQKELTEDERNTITKERVRRTYGPDEVTAELVRKDDDGYSKKLQAHFYLDEGKEYRKEKEISRLNALSPNGKIFDADICNKSLLLKLDYLENVADLVATFLDSGQTVFPYLSGLHTNDSLSKWAKRFNFTEFNQIFGTNLKEGCSPILIAKAALKVLGLGFRCVARKGSRGNQQRFYAVTGLDDGRDAIFEAWLADYVAAELERDRRKAA